MSDTTILLGAVAYDPKVVPIWEGIREHFAEHGVPMDFALFSNYERQVEALLAGHIDVAWDTPLAHVRVQRRTDGRSLSLAMRDSDRDFHAKVVVRRDAGIRTLTDLPAKTLAVGSRDSTQARMLPLYFLRHVGVDVAGVRLLPFDTDVGKHGERDAASWRCWPRSERDAPRRAPSATLSGSPSRPPAASTRRRSRSSGRHPGSITACSTRSRRCARRKPKVSGARSSRCAGTTPDTDA